MHCFPKSSTWLKLLFKTTLFNGSHQPCSWGSRTPDGGTARSPRSSCAGGLWGFGLFWTTEMLEVPLLHTAAHRGRRAAAPESSGTGRDGGRRIIIIPARWRRASVLRKWTARRVYIHRKPCVSNLWLNLNHLIWTSAVGKQLRDPSSYSELEAKQLRVCRNAGLYS